MERDPTARLTSSSSSSSSSSRHFHHHRHLGRARRPRRCPNASSHHFRLLPPISSSSERSSLACAGAGGEGDRVEHAMGDENSSSPIGGRERDLELLIPVTDSSSDSKAASASAHHLHHHSGTEAFYKVIRSWASKKFMSGCVILFPIAITFYITWWFIRFVDGFFSPIYIQLGINIFGLGFVTSIMFIFLVGVFMSSWLGASILSLGEWFIKRMPFVRHIYNASKQIGSAVSPDQNKKAFKEVVIIRHPRIGEYAFGFITSTVSLQSYTGEEELSCVYVPTNHLYVGDIFLINSNDVMKPNLSVREGIEIVVSGGMSMPQTLTTLDLHAIPVTRSARSTRIYP